MTLSLVKLFGVELDASLGSEKLANRSDESDAVLFVFNVVRDVGLGVVAHAEPVKDVRDEFEVGLAEVLHRDVAVVAQCAHMLAEVS